MNTNPEWAVSLGSIRAAASSRETSAATHCSPKEKLSHNQTPSQKHWPLRFKNLSHFPLRPGRGKNSSLVTPGRRLHGRGAVSRRPQAGRAAPGGSLLSRGVSRPHRHQTRLRAQSGGPAPAGSMTSFSELACRFS